MQRFISAIRWIVTVTVPVLPTLILDQQLFANNTYTKFHEKSSKEFSPSYWVTEGRTEGWTHGRTWVSQKALLLVSYLMSSL